MSIYSFTKTHEVDKDKFAELVLAAKGNRSLRSFASACDVYPSTFTRIIQKANKGASSTELIEAIAKNADPQSGVTMTMLAEANGYTLSWYENSIPDKIVNTKSNVLFNDIMRNTVTQELLSREANVKFGNILSNHSLYRVSKNLCVKPTLHLFTDAFEGEEHEWIIKSFHNIELEEDYYHKYIKSRLLEQISYFVLLSVSFSGFTSSSRKRFSIAVGTQWLYDLILDEFGETVVPTDISIIRIDAKNSTIDAEYMLPHVTYGHRPGYFMTTEPVINYQNSELYEDDFERRCDNEGNP